MSNVKGKISVRDFLDAIDNMPEGIFGILISKISRYSENNFLRLVRIEKKAVINLREGDQSESEFQYRGSDQS